MLVPPRRFGTQGLRRIQSDTSRTNHSGVMLDLGRTIKDRLNLDFYDLQHEARD